MLSPATERHALIVGIIVVTLLIVMGGTFFIGVRVGMYQSYRQVTGMLENHESVETMEAPVSNGLWNLVRTSTFGVRGRVARAASGALLIITTDGTRKEVVITQRTQVRENGKLTTGAVRVGDIVSAIGRPTQTGRITATLVRIVDHTTSGFSSSAGREQIPTR